MYMRIHHGIHGMLLQLSDFDVDEFIMTYSCISPEKAEFLAGVLRTVLLVVSLRLYFAFFELQNTSNNQNLDRSDVTRHHHVTQWQCTRMHTAYLCTDRHECMNMMNAFVNL